MHIGFYAAGLPGRSKPSGIVTYVNVMRDALSAIGHDVSIVTKEELLTPTGNILSLKNKSNSKNVLSAIRKVLSLLNLNGEGESQVISAIVRAHSIARFDIFEMEESFGWSADVAARLDVPIVTRLHGPHYFTREPAADDAELRQQSVRIASEGKAIAAAAALTAPSASQLSATLEHYGLLPRLVRHIPNPVVIPETVHCWTETGAVRKQILMVGRFDTIKGADTAIQAFLIAQQTDPALELIIVGPDRGVVTSGGRLDFPNYIASIAGSKPVSGISFLGPRGPGDLAAMRRRAAMVIIPSRIENFPYAVAESLAIGAPTIATDVFGTAEMIADGQNGLLVPVADAPALAQAMLRLAYDRQEAIRLGRAGRAYAINTLAPAPIAEATVAFYREVLFDRSR